MCERKYFAIVSMTIGLCRNKMLVQTRPNTGRNAVGTLAPSFLTGAGNKHIRVKAVGKEPRTCIKAWMSLNFGRILTLTRLGKDFYL